MTHDNAFEHLALFYREEEEFLAGTRTFIDAGLNAGEPVLVAVPGAKIASMRALLNGAGGSVEFWDMNELGANPGRIIPAARDWVQRWPQGRCRFIDEPIWPGRAASEIVEAMRHEALINLAFADAHVTILCPYDRARLDPAVMADAERTHPHVLRDGGGCASWRYTDPVELWHAADWPLPEVPDAVVPCTIGADLAGTRAFAASRLREAGLDDRRLHDVVLAIDEAATNALVHGSGVPELRIWLEGDRLVCEVADCGRLTDPLAGRRRPAPDWPRGRGVWIMNQLCDLVELRPTSTGTAVRLHVKLDDRAAIAYSSTTGG